MMPLIKADSTESVLLCPPVVFGDTPRDTKGLTHSPGIYHRVPLQTLHSSCPVKVSTCDRCPIWTQDWWPVPEDTKPAELIWRGRLHTGHARAAGRPLLLHQYHDSALRLPIILKHISAWI
jgi:hypothetical protein